MNEERKRTEFLRQENDRPTYELGDCPRAAKGGDLCPACARAELSKLRSEEKNQRLKAAARLLIAQLHVGVFKYGHREDWAEIKGVVEQLQTEVDR